MAKAADAREALERFVDEAYNKGNTAEVASLIAEDMVDHDPVPGQAPGRDGTLGKAHWFRSIFPDMRTWNEQVLVEGDRVVHRWVAEGTFQGEFMGLKGDGKKYRFWGIDILRWSDGRFRERWGSEVTWVGGAPWEQPA